MRKSNPFIYVVIPWAIIVAFVLVCVNRDAQNTTDTISTNYEFNSSNVEEMAEVKSEIERESQVETKVKVESESIVEPEPTPFF